MNWREYPMARLLFSLIIGIGLGGYWKAGEQVGLFSTVLLLLLAALLLLQRSLHYRHRWCYGLVVYLFFGVLGSWLFQLHSWLDAPNRIKAGHYLSSGEIVVVEPTAKKVKIQLKLSSFGPTVDSLESSRGKILVYLDKNSQSEALKVGDHIAAEGRVREVEPPLNPHAFDYKAYLARQQIYHQVFIYEDNWKYLGHQSSLLSVASSCRQYFLSVLKTYLPGENEFAVGAALSLGYKSALSDEVRNAYANTGAMHILAVSGLHVGIVQLIVSGLLGLLNLRWKGWRFVRTLMIVLSIWAFALLAGGAPSVLRAATMFSFLAVGLALGRKSSVYNTLAASAFILLCINPNLLYEVGFQLSYLAVLGIVYFQPRIYRLWYVENRIGDYLWQLVAVSIAAQIATLPISLYYFHQFPVYFIFSGLVAVPAAALILSLSLVLFAFHWVPLLSTLLGKGLYGIVFGTNSLIFLIQKLPAGLLKGVWLSLGTVVLLYLIILGVVAAINTRRYAWLQYSMAGLVLVAGWYAFREWQAARQQAVVVYHINGSTALDYFNGHTAIAIQAGPIDEKTIEYAAQQHRWYRRASVEDIFQIDARANTPSYWMQSGYAQLGPYRLAMLQHESLDCGDQPVEVDILLISEHSKIEDAWLGCLHPRVAVVDGSVGYRQVSAWQDFFKEKGIPVHHTRRDGAYTLEN